MASRYLYCEKTGEYELHMIQYSYKLCACEVTAIEGEMNE